MKIIEFENINLSFEEKVILKNFSLAVEKGEKILICGKSGRGKSTLLSILLGFRNFDSGDIYIEGKKVELKDFKVTRNLFSYVNQDVTLRGGRVSEVLKEISLFKSNNFSGEFDETIANKFDFGKALLSKNIEELSGGERQRLGIIVAIMLNRQVFLLDEVTSGLDKELKEKTLVFFENTEKTVIAISHDEQWINSNIFRKVYL